MVKKKLNNPPDIKAVFAVGILFLVNPLFVRSNFKRL